MHEWTIASCYFQLQTQEAADATAGPSAKFDGESMYHERFPAHEVQPRAPRPPREAYKSGGAFDGTTTSRSAYPAHPIQPRTVSFRDWHPSM